MRRRSMIGLLVLLSAGGGSAARAQETSPLAEVSVPLPTEATGPIHRALERIAQDPIAALFSGEVSSVAVGQRLVLQTYGPGASGRAEWGKAQVSTTPPPGPTAKTKYIVDIVTLGIFALALVVAAIVAAF